MSIFFEIVIAIILLYCYYKFNSIYQNYTLVILTILALSVFNLNILYSVLFFTANIFITTFLSPRLSLRNQKNLIKLQIIIIFIFFLTTRSLFKNQLIGHGYLTLMFIGLYADILWKRSRLELNNSLIAAMTYLPIIPIGPIEKISFFSKQFVHKRTLTLDRIKEAILFMSIGLFKITCISIPLAKFTQHQEQLGQIVYGPYLLLYFFFAFVQLYSEFSGLINLTQGISLFFGIKVSINFKQPYLAQSPIDIWNRWHCTFNHWLKEYIYLPILLKTKNIFISTLMTLFVVILWHGLTLSYVYWAVYWFLIIFAYIKFAPYLKKFKLNRSVTMNRLFMILLMSLSTSCFMIDTHGLQNIMNRVLNYRNFAEKYGNSVSELMYESLTITMLCIFLMAIFETAESRKIKYLHFSIPIFISLIIGFGHFTGTQFFYLGL